MPVDFHNKYVKFILNIIQRYNHDKYWKRREITVSPECRKSRILKLYYLLYIKYIDARHNASFGTNLNSGAVFKTPPELPHGPNGIIVGHDCIIGANCKIFQQVTIAHGNVTIGDNVMLGAGAKILPNVSIGNNVKVGANCVVVESIPDNATVVLPKPRVILKVTDQ
jgi:serine acetyltransferase